jgi:hypothetical protein
MIPFIQSVGARSTIACWGDILRNNNRASFAAFAYVTDSGVAQLTRDLGDYFRDGRNCQWVFGIDYGRSHPSALRRMSTLGDHCEVRVHDGEYVVQQRGFVPRTSFHLKTAFILRRSGAPQRQIVGSGNLSAQGLSHAIEAGCVLDYTPDMSEYAADIAASIDRIWQASTPLDQIIDSYEERYATTSFPSITVVTDEAHVTRRLFWIDVGYVTKNRGETRPGNQFDLPRGAHVHLGLPEVIDPAINSRLGDLLIETTSGDIITRPLRFGNNAMEKLTLPIPEEHGYGAYDGKILIFERAGERVILECLEHEDFYRVYGKNIDSCEGMQSGRLYGTIALHT